LIVLLGIARHHLRIIVVVAPRAGPYYQYLHIGSCTQLLSYFSSGIAHESGGVFLEPPLYATLGACSQLIAQGMPN